MWQRSKCCFSVKIVQEMFELALVIRTSIALNACNKLMKISGGLAREPVVVKLNLEREIDQM